MKSQTGMAKKQFYIFRDLDVDIIRGIYLCINITDWRNLLIYTD
jgi:hypothetical protein